MSKRNQKRIEHELKDLINLKDNANRCGECDAVYPTWASVNLGIFLCGRCASMHRKLGTEISIVKSLTHDRWTEDDLESIAAMGNKKAKRLWNPKKTPFPFDDDDKDDIYMYFIKKYQRGSFRYDPPTAEDYNLGASGSYRSRGTSVSSRPSSSASVPRLSHRDIPEMERFKYRKQEPKLQSLGYKNTDDNYEALVLAKGDVTLAADILSKSDDKDEKKPPLPRRPGSSSAPSNSQPQSSDDWWNGNGNASAASAQTALFDGTSAPASQGVPVGANGLIEPPQQYLDPATGIIYVDPVHQQQYELQQQQLLQQQQTFGANQTQQTFGGVPPQQTGIDKSALMSLYNQPTSQQSQQPIQQQQTQAFAQQPIQAQQTAFSMFSGFPQQTGQTMQYPPQQQQQQQQQFGGAPQFTGFQYGQSQGQSGFQL